LAKALRRWCCMVRPFGELRPALAWRDDLRGNGSALDGVRALPAKGKNFSFRGCIRRPMGHPPGPTTCTAVRGAPPLRKKVVSSQWTTKARRSHSLPLLPYSRLGGLRQDPGRAAESAAGPRTDEDMGARRACVVVDLWGTRRRTAGGTGGAVAGAGCGGAGVRAARLGGAADRLVRGKAARDEDVPNTRFDRAGGAGDSIG
jgi:hypothetical protein